MAKQTAFVLCALLALSSAKIFKPRDLADEAEQQLQELESLVRGDILVAHSDFVTLATEFQSYAADVYNHAAIAIQEEYESIDAELTAVLDLAHSGGHDVATCTNIREDVLQRLPATYSEQIAECIRDVNTERANILADATYVVDVVINKVHTLQQQLRNCRGDILCISPLLTEIELSKIQFPQHIKTEVQAAESLLTTLRLSVQQCSDTDVAAYTSQASSILSDIVDCVNRILES